MQRRLIALVPILLAPLSFGPSAAQDSSAGASPDPAIDETLDTSGPVDDEVLRCLSLTRIDHTEVLDDQTLVFYLRGSDIYLNYLDRSCRGLKDEGRFSYRTVIGRLCRGDTISVIETLGVGISAGSSCGLGVFIPADKEMIDAIKGKKMPDAAPVKVETIKIDPTVDQSSSEDANPNAADGAATVE